MKSNPDRKLPDTADDVVFEKLIARFFEDEPRTVVCVEFGALTDRGLVRDNNEDHYLVVRRRRERDVLLTNLPEEHLNRSEQQAYVAGGSPMAWGGHAFGEVASFLALREVWDLGGSEINWPIKMNRRESEELEFKAAVIFRLLDKALQSAAKEQPQLSGMGTTLTICYTTGPETCSYCTPATRERTSIAAAPCAV